MIIVTGTKRSGTSMWMQILVNGGFPYIGEAFPRDWGTVIRDANPEGFYESTLAGGVWWRSNPSPRTGAWLHPKAVENYAVKVFIRGLVRTDYAYIGRVVATVREWRQYEASLRRLFRIKSDNTGADFEEKKVAPLPPGYEWWLENYELIRDIATRRYAVHVLSYASLLEDPEGTISKVFDWIGRGDKEKAWKTVKRELNTQKPENAQTFTSVHAELFDDLYHRIHIGEPLDKPFLDKMNETHLEIVKEVQDVAPGYFRQRERADYMAPPTPQDADAPQAPQAETPAQEEQPRQAPAQAEPA